LAVKTFDCPGWRARVLGLAWCIALAHTAGCRDVIGIDKHRFIAADSAVPGELVSCQSYCDDVLKSCTADELKPYKDAMDCLAVCKHLPPGSKPDATSDNSVSCRAHYAEEASGAERDMLFCPAATPGGGGPTMAGAPSCGDNCDAYCDLYKQICPETPLDQCETRCRGLPDRGMYSAVTDFSDYDDTIQCRIAHLTAAARASYNAGNAKDAAERSTEDGLRKTHCGHSALRPRLMADNTPCDLKADKAPNCEDYCQLIMTACTGGNRVYDDKNQCVQVCNKGFPAPAGLTENMPETAVNTLSCRRWHAYYALTDIASTHCPHAGPSGGNDCGKPCEVYCSLLEAGCKRRYTDTYGADDQKCLDECATLSASETYSIDGEGVRTNTYQCRMHNLTKVFGGAGGGNGMGMEGCDKGVFPKDTCP
jgi:hypothetical protein